MVTPDSIKSSIEAGIACDTVLVSGDGQHRLVYAALGDRMRAEIHALSMTTVTPDEHSPR